MKTCKKCNGYFPYKMKIKDKWCDLSNRSYCLKCSPYKTTKNRLWKINEHENKSCPICERDFPWTKNDICSSCRSTKRRHENKRKAVELLGGKCCKCDLADLRVLQFHHEGDKEYELASILGCSWNRIENEVKKCQLLCGNCHTILHSEETELLLEKIFQYYKE